MTLQPSSAPMEEIARAAAVGDAQALDRLLPQVEQLSVLVAQAVANAYMRRQRWQDGAEVLARFASNQPACEMQRRTAGNFAALQSRRPEVYGAILRGAGQNRYSAMPTSCGQFTIVYPDAAGRPVSLSASATPAADAANVLCSLREEKVLERTIGVMGTSDGYLLDLLARNPPDLLFGRRPPIFFIEPDPALLMTCMAIHDFTGPAGPIEQERFLWFVGPDWHKNLRELLLRDHNLVARAFNLWQTPERPSVEPRLEAVLQEITQVNEALQRQVNGHYAQLPRERLLEAFIDPPARRPRALLLTSRFTSVLQYSTADAAAAFGQLGWETRTLIEPSVSRDMTPTTIRQALADYKPDMVFQIDHLRYEHGGVVPANVPFVCWIQDALPTLNCEAAGKSVGPRDYVLTPLPIYRDRYGYPARQIIGIHRLTRVPRRPASWQSDGDDLVYVSNASQLSEETAAQLIGESDGTPRLQAIIRGCCRRMMRVYEQGGALATINDVGRTLGEAELEAGAKISDPVFRREAADGLFYRLNNLLYRQQALRWAAAIARRCGLGMSLYGRGWEKNPEFAPYARGPVNYGEDLEKLTRAGRINLQLEPYFCVSHQRLLDGLVAGGFFLIRRHVSNSLTQDLSDFLHARVPATTRTTEQARACLDEAGRAELDDLLNRWEPMADMGDPVEQVRRGQDAYLLISGQSALPRLEEVEFHDEASMEERIAWFIAEPGLRMEMAGVQRDAIERRLSYEAGMRRLFARLGELIASEEAA